MSRFLRTIAMIVFGYFAYRTLYSQSDSLSDPLSQLQDPLSKLQDSSSWVYSMLSSFGSLVTYCLSKIADITYFIFSFLWSFIGFIWILFLTGVNVVYFINIYYSIKNRGSNNISGFIGAFCLLVAVPTGLNWLLGQRNLALNIGLPLSLAIFVDAINAGPRPMWVNTRNLIVFTLLAAFI